MKGGISWLAIAGVLVAGCSLGRPLTDETTDETGGVAQGQTCQAWYEEGAAPSGFENVGVCAVPL